MNVDEFYELVVEVGNSIVAGTTYLFAPHPYERYINVAVVKDDYPIDIDRDGCYD